MANIAVIGAGIAGIAAARELARRGLQVSIFDRGRNVGGRCATRDNEFSFDHGAPFFTISDESFRTEMAMLESLAVVRQWNGRFVEINAGQVRAAEDGTRYVGVPGMRRIAETLATDLEVMNRCEIKSLSVCPQGWRLTNIDESEVGDYSAVILAMPPEQARKLIPADTTIFPQLANIKSTPRWVLMITFETALDMDFDAAKINNSPLESIVKQSSKPGRGTAESWVIYSSQEWAEKRIKADPEEIANALAAELRRFTNRKLPNIAHTRAHRWRLAFPQTCLDVPYLWDDDNLIGVCGDWCQAPSIEGAFMSGTACGVSVARALAVESV